MLPIGHFMEMHVHLFHDDDSFVHTPYGLTSDLSSYAVKKLHVGLWHSQKPDPSCRLTLSFSLYYVLDTHPGASIHFCIKSKQTVLV